MSYRGARGHNGRRQGPESANPVFGPSSALTDYLQANNISAFQIRANAIARQQAAAAAAAAAGGDATAAGEPNGDTVGTSAPAAEEAAVPAGPTTEPRKRRKKDDGSAMSSNDSGDDDDENTKGSTSEKKKKALAIKEKVKQKKEAKKNAKKRGQDVSSDEESDIGRALRKPMKRLPGQFANCDNCEKKFTVTAYSKASGVANGLLCNECSKTVDPKESKARVKKPVKAKGLRYKEEAKALDSSYARNEIKSLASFCLDAILANAGTIEDLGEMPDKLKSSVNKIMSKARCVKPETLDMFLQDKPTQLALNDCAYLRPDDLNKVFLFCPTLRSLTLRNANQFTGECVKYAIERGLQLEELSVHGANLITSEEWILLFKALGPRIRKLKIARVGENMDAAALLQLCILCPNIEHLSIRVVNESLDNDVLRAMKTLKKLEYLSLEFIEDFQPEPSAVRDLIQGAASNLKKLSLKNLIWAEDDVLEDIHNTCRQLNHLTITGNERFTDAGFVRLFSNWSNGPLAHINFSECRHVERTDSVLNRNSVGLCDEGFKAIIAHSGQVLQKLSIRSCRHITPAAFHGVFDPNGMMLFTSLLNIDVGFTAFDKMALYRLFICAPNLRQVSVFGLFDIVNPHIPIGTKVFGIVGDRAVVYGKVSMSELLGKTEVKNAGELPTETPDLGDLPDAFTNDGELPDALTNGGPVVAAH